MISGQKEHFSDPAGLAAKIQKLTLDLAKKVAETSERITSIKSEIHGLFQDFKGKKYHLFGVFMHDGEANFGHYWHYLYDSSKSRWLKYNDSLVTEVQEEEVFANTTGKTFSAFSLIFVEQERLSTLTSPFCRTPDYRQRCIELGY